MRRLGGLRVVGIATSLAVLTTTFWVFPGFAEVRGVALPSVRSQAKPKPNPKGDRARPKPKVAAKKGKARGTFNTLASATRAPTVSSKDTTGPTSRKKISVNDQESIAAGCWAQTEDTSCLVTGPSDVATLLTGSLARAMAVNLVVQLRFPAPKPIFGPDPAKNEWKMLAVGFPVWLWTEGPTVVSTSTSSNGFTFQMTARWRSTTFHMGDGNSVTCTAMTKYSASVKPGTASPNCGYVYTKPSLPKGKYEVRAVADWDVAWSVAGFSGVIPAYNEASASIPIGELSALNR